MNELVIKPDRFTRGVLAAIAVLLGLIALELWQLSPSMLPTAQAQIPDGGLQRNAVIEETRKTNRLLEDILSHLRTKALKVEMTGQSADKKPGTRSTSDRP